MSQQTVVEQLPAAIASAEGLPSPPTVALEVLRLTRDPDAGFEDLTQVISRDPVLAARLLKLANSAMFARGAAVTSLDQATARLGMKTVMVMALGFSLTTSLLASDEPGAPGGPGPPGRRIRNRVRLQLLLESQCDDGDRRARACSAGEESVRRRGVLVRPAEQTGSASHGAGPAP